MNQALLKINGSLRHNQSCVTCPRNASILFQDRDKKKKKKNEICYFKKSFEANFLPLNELLLMTEVKNLLIRKV